MKNFEETFLDSCDHLIDEWTEIACELPFWNAYLKVENKTIENVIDQKINQLVNFSKKINSAIRLIEEVFPKNEQKSKNRIRIDCTLETLNDINVDIEINIDIMKFKLQKVDKTSTISLEVLPDISSLYHNNQNNQFEFVSIREIEKKIIKNVFEAWKKDAHTQHDSLRARAAIIACLNLDELNSLCADLEKHLKNQGVAE